WGLTASTQKSAPSTASPGVAKHCTPKSAHRRSRLGALRSATRIREGSPPRATMPPTRLLAMFPPPMQATTGLPARSLMFLACATKALQCRTAAAATPPGAVMTGRIARRRQGYTRPQGARRPNAASLQRRGVHGPPLQSARGARMDIAELLAFSVKNKASDLHLTAGMPPMIRGDGDVRRTNLPALDRTAVHALVYDIMSDKQRRDYEEFLEVDFSFEIAGLARFRVNAFNQNRGAGAVFRTIPSEVLTLEDLGTPRIFRELIDQP